jgi:hypothetical protein
VLKIPLLAFIRYNFSGELELSKFFKAFIFSLDVENPAEWLPSKEVLTSIWPKGWYSSS